MSELTSVIEGDVGETRAVVLHGVDSLDGVASVEATIWKCGDAAATAATLSASVADAAAGVIVVEFGDASGWLATDATPGTWNLRYRVTFTDGPTLTWPNVGGADTIRVLPAVG